MKAIVHGCYHNGNFGDLLLMEILSNFLRKNYRCRVVCPWVRTPPPTDLTASVGRGFMSTLWANAAIFGGGGYLNDRNADPRAVRRLLRYSAPATWWRISKVPYVIVGVGVGPLASQVAKDRIRTICDGAKAISVRDEESKAILVDAGIEESSIGVTADWVLLLNKQDIPEHFQDRASILLGERREGVKRLGIHLESLSNQPSLMEKTLDALSAAIECESHIEPYWIVDSNASSLLENQIKDYAAKKLPQLNVIPLQHFWTTAALLGSMDGLITSKLHVGITGWALGVPVCGFSSHIKSQRFYRQIRRTNFQVNASDTQTNCVAEWVHSMGRDYSVFSHNDDAARSALRRAALGNLDIVNNHLGAYLRNPASADVQ